MSRVFMVEIEGCREVGGRVQERGGGEFRLWRWVGFKEIAGL